MAYEIKTKKLKEKKTFPVLTEIKDEDGYLKGNFQVTKSSFDNPKMYGVYTQKGEKFYVEGYWEEGSFNIEKVKGGRISEEAKVDLEEYIEEELKGEYTD